MTITARELNRATLARQLLLRREPLGVVEAVRRIVALQAQQAESPYLALWNRLDGFDPKELDAAFAGYEIVKATLMRITLHAVHAADHGPFRVAMQPTLRSARLDSRFRQSGVSVEQADALVPGLLEFAGTPRSSAEVQAWLDERLGEPAHPAVWRALRSFSPILHAPTGEPWSFGQRPSYVSTDGLPEASAEASAAALRTLVVRYLEGFGPASVDDVAQFALVQKARARAAVQALSGSLEQLAGPDGKPLYDVPGGLRPAAETPAPPRLMAMWDSVLLAYADRGRVIPPEYRKLVTRVNGDVLPTLLVDGHVAGVWREVDGRIEATAFRPLSAATWAGLTAEASALLTLLADREPRIYRRYHHWWAKLPDADVRVLAG